MEINQAKCTKLSFSAAVNFAKSDDKITGFELDGYTGAAVDRWWGKLVIDLSGMSSKQKMPIFLGHEHNKIVGYSTKTTTAESFKVQGVFSKSTEAAKEVMALAGEGFPWQASIGVSPKVITEIKEGATLEVNGVELSGPAEVWSQSEVYETSFVPLGADGNTSATVFSNIEEVAELATTAKRPKEATNKEDTPMDLKTLREKHSELVALIESEALTGMEAKIELARQEGRTEERVRIQSIQAQTYPGQEAIVLAAMWDGKSQPGDVAMAINAANIESLKKAGDELSSDAPIVVDEPSNNGELKQPKVKTEESLKKTWDKDAKLRAEFMDDFELCKASILPVEGLAFKSLKNRGNE